MSNSLKWYHKHKDDLGYKEKKAEYRKKYYLKNKEIEDKKAYDRKLKNRKLSTPIENNQLYFFDNIKIKNEVNNLILISNPTLDIKKISKLIFIPYQTFLSIYKLKTLKAKKSTIEKICNYLKLELSDIIFEKTKR